MSSLLPAPDSTTTTRRRRRGASSTATILPTSLLITLLWLALPRQAKLIIRKSIADKLVKLAVAIGGPGFTPQIADTASKAQSPPRGNAATAAVVPRPAPLPAARRDPPSTSAATTAAIQNNYRIASPDRSRDPKPAEPPLSIDHSPGFSTTLATSPSFNDDDIEEEDDYIGGDASSGSISDPDAVKVPRAAPLTPYAPSPHRPHRHTPAGEAALSLLKTLEPIDSWEFVQEKSAVRIFTRPVLDGTPGALPIVRGEGIIAGIFTPQEVFSVIRSSNCRKTWDPRYDYGESIEYFNVDEALSYSVQKGSFPVAARDLVTFLACRRDSSTGSLTYIATSVTDPTAPGEGRGRVRAHLTLAGWILTPGNTGVHATYIVQVDPKGTIPSALIRLLQVQTPLCITEVSSYLSRTGPIPFIVRDAASPALGPGPDVSVMTEEHDATAARYELDYTVRAAPASVDGRRGVVSVALPRVLFAHGADLSVNVSPAGAAEVRARLARDEELGSGVARVVGPATVAVVVLWIDGEEGDVEVEIRVEVGRHGVVVNGEPVEY